MNYSRNFGSSFPQELIAPGNHKDIDAAAGSLIAQYNQYMQNGNIAAAGKLYQDNKALLSLYMLDTSYINLLEEELYNTGLFALLSHDTIVSESQPGETQDTGGYWLQDY